ncbi:MAG: hypothetical protein QM758_25670 [Armatimonas sp.]
MPLTFIERAPRVLFLLHGSTAIPERGKPAQPGSLAFARQYFSFGFTRKLLGESLRLFTRGGVELTAPNWEKTALGDRVENQILTIQPRTLDRILVLIPYDGSRHLVVQTREVIDKIQEAIDTLNLAQANYSFMAHSMGGLVMRTLLTASDDSIDGERLSVSDRRRASAIADKTLYLITLATPHEGSPVADRSTEIRDVVRKIPTDKVGLGRIDLSEITGGLIGNANQYQLKTALWRTLNRGTLSPLKMTRSDGTLIPIYTLSGRTPGGPYFTSPKDWPLGNFPLTSMTTEDSQCLGTMVVDWAIHAVAQSKNAWAPIPLGARGMDTTARYARLKFGSETSKPNPMPKLDGIFPEFAFPVYYVRRREGDLDNNDGGADADGLVPITSGLGMTMGGSVIEPFDHSRRVQIDRTLVPGPWYRLTTGPWDKTNHVTIYRNADVSEWLFDNILKSAGPFPALAGFSTWR